MRQIFATVVSAAILTAAPAGAADLTVAGVAVARIEAALRLPPRASPLGEYARYYADCRNPKAAGCTDNMIGGLPRGRYVVGVFMLEPKIHPPHRPGAYVVAASGLPVAFDGGCSVVHIVYDLDARRVLSVACNGYA